MANQENGSIAAQFDAIKSDENQGSIRVDYSEPYTRTYSNIARVVNGAHDVAIDFALIGTPQTITEEDPHLKARVTAQVFMPQGMVPSLIGILYRQLTDAAKGEAKEAMAKMDDAIGEDERES